MQDKKKEMKERIQKKIEYMEELDDEGIQAVIDEILLEYARDIYLTMEEKQSFARECFNEIRRLDVLQELIEDDTITEIMINGYRDIFIESKGNIKKWEKHFLSKEKLEDVVQQMVSKANRMVNESNPIVDSRLEDGSRIHVVLSPVALDGPVVTIRKFPLESITMEQLILWEAMTEEAAEFLRKLVVSRYNIFVSGGTGSGKTTLLNVLSNYIPQEERVITIEDSAELQIRKVPNLVRLETRESILEEGCKITMTDLIKASLRMRPDRIIVGEVRDGAAVVNMLQAMNTGAAAMSTGHANSSKDMLNRLEALALVGMNMPLLSVRKQIASAIDIIVHLGRLRDKSRRVLEIVEVLEGEDMEILTNPLYCFKEEGKDSSRVKGRLVAQKNSLKNTEKLEKAGIMQ
ncbi:MAG: CpaF family protein [Acetivibrio sp.]